MFLRYIATDSETYRSRLDAEYDILKDPVLFTYLSNIYHTTVNELKQKQNTKKIGKKRKRK